MKRFWLALFIVLFLVVPSYSATISSGGTQIINQGVTPLPIQPKINITGPAASCSNGSGQTDCTFSQAGAPPSDLYVKGHTYPAELLNMGASPTSTIVNSGWTTTAYVPSTSGGLTFASASSQYITVANEGNFDFEYNQAFSFAAWIKTSTSGSNMQIVSKRNTALGYIFRVENNCNLTFWLGASSTSLYLTSKATVCDGIWHHVVVTKSTAYTYSAIHFYVDGQSAGVTQVTSTLAGTILNNEPVRIAAVGSTPTEFFDGSLDNVAIFNTELTLSQVQALCGWDGMACTSPNNLTGTETGLVAGFNFNDGSGNTAVSVPAGNNGDLTGHAPTWAGGVIWAASTDCPLGSKCVAFDGSNDYIKVYGADIYPSGSTARTVEADIFITSTTHRSVIYSYGDDLTDNKGFDFEVNGWQASSNGKLVIRTRNNALQSNTSISLNTWTHVAVTFDGTNTTLGTATKMFINGADEGALAAVTGMGSTGTINTTASQGYIGAEPTCLYEMPGCLSFDGTDDYVSIADSDEPASAISLSIWVYPTDLSGNRSLMAKWSQAQYRLLLTNGTVLWGMASATQATSPEGIPLNKWSLITITHTGTTAKIYINGMLVKANLSATSYTAGSGAGAWNIGAMQGSYYFKGMLFDARIYSTELSKSEIFNIYNYGHPIPCVGGETGLMHCWKLSDGSGTTSVSLPSGNNGTLTGFSSTTAIDTDGWQTNGMFAGSMDEVRVWNVARSQSEINSYQSTECTGHESGLALCYHFNYPNPASVVAYQTADVSGIGSDSNNCTSTSTPCKTINGALLKITSKFFSANSTIHISSGAYTEVLDFTGYHPTGNFDITLEGTLNITPNSFTNTPIFSGTSTGGPNTANFPKDTRTFLFDTTKTFTKDVEEGWLEITGGKGLCSGINGHDFRNWYPIEKYYYTERISVVSRYSNCNEVLGGSGLTYDNPDSTTTYNIYRNSDLTHIIAGAKAYVQPTAIVTGPISYIGNNIGINIKDSSGIIIRKLWITNADQYGIYTSNSSIDEISNTYTSRNNYTGILLDMGSKATQFRANISTDNNEGLKWMRESIISVIKGNLVLRQSNCGMCNYFQSGSLTVVDNMIGAIYYACFDGESGYTTYFTGFLRVDTCGNGGGIEVQNYSYNNIIYPTTISNSVYGLLIGQYSAIATTFNIGYGTLADVEFLYNDVGILTGVGGITMAQLQYSATFTGNGTKLKSGGFLFDASDNSAPPGIYNLHGAIYLKNTGSLCELHFVLSDGTDVIIPRFVNTTTVAGNIKAAACP